jgi:hypothetical protein
MVLIPVGPKHFAKVSDRDAARVRKHRWSRVQSKGKPAYAAAKPPGAAKPLYLHRLIMAAPAHLQVDHRNRDGLDCRRCNLRLATVSQNNANLPRRKDNTSGHKGVFWAAHAKRWRVRVGFQHVGYFTSLKEAARAYNRVAKKKFGTFARLNAA